MTNTNTPVDIRKLAELEKANDELDLDNFMLNEILSDKLAVEALNLLIGKGYSAADIKIAAKAMEKKS